jgi:ABC-type phosphate transport system substrate-binding protein
LGVSPDAFPAGTHLPQHGHGETEGLFINRYLPSRARGSVDVLETVALNGKRLAVSASEYESMVELTKAVAADPFGIGFGGRSQVAGLKVLTIQRGAESPAILPTPTALRDRSYPLSHYLYFYFVGEPAGEVKDFLRFVVSREGQRVVADAGTGLVTLPLIGGPSN